MPRQRSKPRKPYTVNGLMGTKYRMSACWDYPLGSPESAQPAFRRVKTRSRKVKS